MLSAEVRRYVELRRGLGYKLVQTELYLRAFAQFADDAGDSCVLAARALQWASNGSTPVVRGTRLRTVALFAAFLRTENPVHEVPPVGLFPTVTRRQAPYIYGPDEIERLLEAAGRIHASYRLRRETYATILGLVACTGMRISEVLGLAVEDIEPGGGVIVIRAGKFGKARRVPLHPTAVEALSRYVDARWMLVTFDRHLFLSANGRRISRSMVNYTFRTIAKLAGIETRRARPCRIHDLRHTFATRALETCAADRGSVAEQFVALSTYLGHADIKHTYWYFEATPELMRGMAQAAEALVARGAS